MSDNADVLVVGGGTAGIAAARELTEAGLQVILLESRGRLGGRIFTDHGAGFPVELGAEFVHGRSPDIFGPIEQARLDCAEVAGEMRQKRTGLWDDSGNVMAEVNHLFENMPSAGPDQSFKHYIDGSGYRTESKELALNFVEGFHAADPARVSVHWLIRATQAEEAIDGETSFRFVHGYSGLVNALFSAIDSRRCETVLNARVTEIRWQPGEVLATTDSGVFHAPRAIITLPPGVLQSGSVRFDPALPDEKQKALRSLAMGQVIRVTLSFRDKFWEQLPEMRNLSFLFTDNPRFPTWWSSNPLPYPILTGWAAGKYARALAGLGSEDLASTALKSLAQILEIDEDGLHSHLAACFVHDWQADPFSCGAYSYVVCGGLGAPAALAAPVEDALFFAGEATDIEGHNGTVHGAIGSGKRAARDVLKTLARNH